MAQVVAGMVLLPDGVLPYWTGEDAITATPEDALRGFLETDPMPEDPSVYDWGTSEQKWADTAMVNWLIKRLSYADTYLLQHSLCGGFNIRKARSGRLICEVIQGDTHRISMKMTAGDRTWGNWEDRRPEDPNAFGIARPETNGGGCWVELLILPLDGKYKTASQVRYEAEVI